MARPDGPRDLCLCHAMLRPERREAPTQVELLPAKAADVRPTVAVVIPVRSALRHPTNTDVVNVSLALSNCL